MKLHLPKVSALESLTVLFLLLLPFERLPSWEVVFGSTSYTLRLSHVAAALLIAGFLLTRTRALLELVSDRLWLLLCIFIAAAAVGASFSAYPGHSFFYVAFDAFVMLTAFAVAHVVAERRLLQLIFKVALLDLAIVAVVGLYQFVGDTFGLSTALTGLKSRYTKSVFSFPRIQATELEPLYLANYLLLLLGILWSSQKRFILPALSVIALLLSLTLSRGAYLAAAAMAVIFIIFRVSPWRSLIQRYTAILVGIGFALLFVWGSSSIGSHKTNGVEKFAQQATNLSKGTSVDDRALSRHMALEEFKATPLLGVGVGNFGREAAHRDPAYFPVSAIANNEPVELLAETGAVGFLSILAFVGLLLFRSLKAWRRADAELKGWLVGLSATIVGFAVQYQGFSTLYVIHIWAAIGLLVAVQQMALSQSSPKSPRTKR